MNALSALVEFAERRRTNRASPAPRRVRSTRGRSRRFRSGPPKKSGCGAAVLLLLVILTAIATSIIIGSQR